MDGLKLAHAVRNRWPPVEIIVMSGKSRRTMTTSARGMFFSKPVDEGLLRQALRNIQANEVTAARSRAADGSCRSPNGAGTKASVAA